MGPERIGAAIGILTFLGGLLAWHRGTVESSVSLKRDWNHFRKNQEQMIQNISFLSKETDTRLDQIDVQLIEIKAMFYASLTHGRHGDDKS